MLLLVATLLTLRHDAVLSPGINIGALASSALRFEAVSSIEFSDDVSSLIKTVSACLFKLGKDDLIEGSDVKLDGEV